MQYRFVDNYPTTGNWRSRVYEAANTWSAIPNIVYPNFDFQQGFADYTEAEWNWDSISCAGYDYQEDGVGVTDFTDFELDDELAMTQFCESNHPGVALMFQIALSDDYMDENSTKFFTGDGDTDDPNWTSNEHDLLGTLVHEFGHATGRFGNDGHYEFDDENDQAACPGTVSEADATMCRYLQPDTAKWRTLTTHDISSFNNVPNYN